MAQSDSNGVPAETAASFAQDRKPALDSRLLEQNELAELGPPEAVRLPIALVDENPNNPRKQLLEVAELAESIREFGLLQPITVRRQADRYELLGGHRRRAAFLLLAEAEPFNVAWRTIPAVIRTFDDEQGYLALLAGQLHSRNWNPKEEARVLEDLASTRTLAVVASLIHKSPVWVSHRLKVFADAVLSPHVQLGHLAASVADELRLIKDADLRRTLAERAIAEDWGKERARSEVRKLRSSAMIALIGRQARDMLASLALIQQAAQLPPETAADLWKVQRRIVALGRGVVLPTIAEAQQAAGVNPNTKPRREKKRRRTMPPPA